MDFRVGQWLVRPGVNAIVHEGRPCHVTPKAMEVLVCLANHHGEVVTKAELFQQVWAGAFVTDDALTRCIGELRRAFEDDAKAPALIQTIVKRGYLLLAPVVWERDEAHQEAEGGDSARTAVESPLPEPAGPAPARTRGSAAWKLRRFAAIAGLVCLAAMSGSAPSRRSTTGFGVKRIAVLPLENLSGDPGQEYFAEGLTDALITELAQIRRWQVISRTSVLRYRRTRLPLRQIAHDLGADGIVEGTVLRSGGRVRITAQLIDAAADRHLWSRSFEREESGVLSLQSSVARAIADELQVGLSPPEQARLKRTRKVVPEAYEAYLRGWYFFERNQFPKAASYFEQATIGDPSFALAHALLYEADSMVQFRQDQPLSERALKAIERARELDDSLAEVHDAWGDVMFFGNWDWKGGEAEYLRAVELDPGSIDAAEHYCLSLHALRRWDAAMRESRRELQLDPVSPRINLQRLALLVDTHQYGLAEEQFQRVIDLDPGSASAYSQIGSVYAVLGRVGDATTAFLKADALSGKQGEAMLALEEAARAGGWPGYWRKRLEQLRQEAKRAPVSRLDLALIHLRLGEHDEALRLLETAYRQHAPRLAWINAHSQWDPLRPDPRFQVLLRRMQFPE